MRLHPVVAIASLVSVVAVSVLVGAASAHTVVNRRCYDNRLSKPGTLRWWADCANNWGPHAFTAAELRGYRVLLATDELTVALGAFLRAA